MTTRTFLLLSLLVLPACDGQQYASPDTVRLVVTENATQTDVVNRCRYVPILLGSEVRSRYSVSADIKVTLQITRDEVKLSYEDPEREHEPFSVPAPSFEDQFSVVADSGPEAYTFELSSPCAPDDSNDYP